MQALSDLEHLVMKVTYSRMILAVGEAGCCDPAYLVAANSSGGCVALDT